MTDWTQQLIAQPGNYQPILQTITQADGNCLQAIYDNLDSHATICGKSLLDYILGGICVDMREQVDATQSPINVPSIATLKAVGVILTLDNIHIGLTPLGYGFMQAMLAD